MKSRIGCLTKSRERNEGRQSRCLRGGGISRLWAFRGLIECLLARRKAGNRWIRRRRTILVR
jgi:hypothetical protein